MERVGLYVAILVTIVATTSSASKVIGKAQTFRSAIRLFDDTRVVNRLGDFKGAKLNQQKNVQFLTREKEGIFTNKRQQTTCELSDDLRDQQLAELQCDADYLSALQDLEGIECSFVATLRPFSFFASERSFPECGRDTNGVLCGVHDEAQNDPDDVARDIVNECLGNAETCTNQCKNLLEGFVNRFDCCIHLIEVTSSDELIRVLTPQLWDDCGVELPAPCDNAPPEVPPLNFNVSCDIECTINQAQALFCKYLAQEAISIYLECGDDVDALRIQQSCGFNENGDFCFPVGGGSFPLNVLGFFASFFIESDGLNDEYFLDMYSKCISFVSGGKCPPECRDALIAAKNTYGCCFNNANGTALGLSSSSGEPEDSIRNFVTSYDLWSGCVVETPEFCHFPTDTSIYDELLRCSPEECESETETESGRNLLPGIVVIAAIPVILLMIAVPPMIYCCYRKSKRNSARKTSSDDKKTSTNSTRPVVAETSITTTTLPRPPDNVNTTSINSNTLGHLYDYVSMQDSKSTGLLQRPPPNPTDSITADMTNNASYNRVQHNVKDNDHYVIPDPTASLHHPPPNPMDSISTANLTNNASYNRVQYNVEDDEHYVIPNPTASLHHPPRVIPPQSASLQRPPLEIPSGSASLQRRPAPLPDNNYTVVTTSVNSTYYQRPIDSDDGNEEEGEEEDEVEEYITMMDNPAHNVIDGGSSVPKSAAEVVMYI